MPALPCRSDLLRARLDAFTRTLQGIHTGDVRSVHRARVASRRLRELIPVLQLDRDVCDKLGRRFRRVTRVLGTVRELDVLLQLAAELHESGRYPERALGRVSADVRVARTAEGKKLSRNGTTVELRRVARKLESVARAMEAAESRSERDSGRAWRWAMDARVSRRAAAVRHAINEAGAVYLPERLHAVRIDLKKLRYGLELVTDAAGTPATADLTALKRSQELLGRLHDLQVLIERVRRVQATLEPPDLGAWRDLDGLVMALDGNCRRLHARYVRDRGVLLELCQRLAARAPLAAKRLLVRRAG